MQIKYKEYIEDYFCAKQLLKSYSKKFAQKSMKLDHLIAL